MRRTITYYSDNDVDQRLISRPTLNDREAEIIASASNASQLSLYDVDPTDDNPYDFKTILSGSFLYKTANPLSVNDISSTSTFTGWKFYAEIDGKSYLLWEVSYETKFSSLKDLDIALEEYAIDDEVICLAPSAQNDVIYTYAGNDRIKPAKGDDYVNGGDGIDTLVLSGKYSEYQVSWDYDQCTVADLKSFRDGSDVAVNIERIEFSDRSFAYDMDGNAGVVTKILGAVFGKTSIDNETYVGIGLDLLDGGMSYETLIGLALEVKLGKGYSLAQEVDLLERNVYGITAPTNVQSFWAARGAAKETVAINYAESDVNITNIDLVGLFQTGIEYL